MAFSTMVVPAHATVDGAVETPGDLTVEGRVEGELRVGGEVVIEAGATCVAFVSARSLEIRGELLGDAVCADAIRVIAGGRVVGDLRAPNVEVDADAQVDGRVDLLPPEPRGATIQRMPLSARGPIRRPALPPNTGSPDIDQLHGAEFDEVPTRDERSLLRHELTPPEHTPVTRDDLPRRRVVPKPPHPTGRVRVVSRNRS